MSDMSWNDIAAVEKVQHDAGTLTGECLHGSGPNAGVATGHQDGLPVQLRINHRHSSTRAV